MILRDLKPPKNVQLGGGVHSDLGVERRGVRRQAKKLQRAARCKMEGEEGLGKVEKENRIASLNAVNSQVEK